MSDRREDIIVGILGQWASGKSSAAKTLIRHLGGENEVIFITDREILARQAVNYILELEDSKVNHSIEDDGSQHFDCELVTVYLAPGEDLKTVDLNTLQFGLHDAIYDNVAIASFNWLDLARIELGNQIQERSAEGKPIVIEAGFGTNVDPRGENPLSHSLADFFMRLEETGVEPQQVKWLIVEASYEKRAARNEKREDSVPAVEFDRFAADGGDLDPDHQKRLEEAGTVFKRVPNDHDDFAQFKSDIINAFQELFHGVSPTIDGKRA